MNENGLIDMVQVITHCRYKTTRVQLSSLQRVKNVAVVSLVVLYNDMPGRIMNLRFCLFANG